MREVNISEATAPLILAIDVGSSSVRTLVFDRDGAQVSEVEHQLRYQLTTDKHGTSTVDAERLVDLTARSVSQTLTTIGARATDLAAVATTTFWHSLLALDDEYRPLMPVLMWSDNRSAPCARALADELDERHWHNQTGCRFHSSYWPAKMRWLADTHPSIFERTRWWVSFADYLTWRLQGTLQTSISMASGTGLLNTATCTWDAALLDHIGVQIGSLPPLVDRAASITGLEREWARRWPALTLIPWFPAIGDGAAANVGSSCVSPRSIALTVGTSGAMRIIQGDGHSDEPACELPDSLWCYRLDASNRVYGGALSNGGNATAWVRRLTNASSIDELTALAAKIDPDSHGLTMLPFLAGERAPSWDDSLDGALLGLTLATTTADVFRATLESTAYRFAAIHDDLMTYAERDYEIHANGGAILASPLWTQILADTLGAEIHALDADAEASARGAAICALESLGVISTLDPDSPGVVRTYHPDRSRGVIYQRARHRTESLEHALREWVAHDRT